MTLLLALSAHAAPPTAPLIAAPVDGAVVATATPELRLEQATDPDGDVLSYHIFVQDMDGNALYDAPANVYNPWAGINADPIAEDTWTCWYGVASDGVDETASSTSCFFMTTTNDPPTAPEFLVGGLVGTSLAVKVRNGVDAEGRGETQVLQLYTEQGTLIDSKSVDTTGPGESNWGVTLEEDTAYILRARATDGVRVSEWVEAWILASDTNGAPEAPRALSPADGASFEGAPELVVKNAVDPEGDALTYSFELMDADGEVVDQSTDVAEGSTSTAWTPTATLDEGYYSWTALATDADGAQSPPSEVADFWVGKAGNTPGTADPGGEDGGKETKDVRSGYAGGGGCSSTPGGQAGWLGLAGLVGLMFVRRRR